MSIELKSDMVVLAFGRGGCNEVCQFQLFQYLFTMDGNGPFEVRGTGALPEGWTSGFGGDIYCPACNSVQP